MIQIRGIFKAVLFFLLAFWSSSCGREKIIYEKKIDLPSQGWAHADTLDFPFQIVDTTKIYDLVLEITHTPDYAFQNLYVLLHTRFPTGERTKERVSLELADATGKWQGATTGAVVATPIAIQTNAYFNKIGDYALTAEQFMRSDTLENVKSVTFKIEDTGKKR